MPDYQKTYNHIYQNVPCAMRAENSFGLRSVVKHANELSLLCGRSLDVGCGPGFVIEFLSGPTFDFRAFGIDVSDVAVEAAKQRLDGLPGIESRLKTGGAPSLPYDDNFFSLVTCFNVLETLDEADAEQTIREIDRVLKPGGVLFCTVACSASEMNDEFGDNLHRTIRQADWWIEKLSPLRTTVDGNSGDVSIWKRLPLQRGDMPTSRQTARKRVAASSSVAGPDSAAETQRSETQHPKTQRPAISTDIDRTLMAASAASAADAYSSAGASTMSSSMSSGSDDSHDTSELYQRIYDENQWYGDAETDRCPGVRLLPKYRDWLLSPVIDLGCGRGHTVEKIRELGMECTGIDQIKINPEMRVGDITSPIADIANFKSAVCIDCIEHLYDEQLLGLFENLKKVERQAFSIHNGESTGTGQELHVNRRDFIEWGELIREHFTIAAAIKIHEQQMLYLTQRK